MHTRSIARHRHRLMLMSLLQLFKVNRLRCSSSQVIANCRCLLLRHRLVQQLFVSAGFSPRSSLKFAAQAISQLQIETNRKGNRDEMNRVRASRETENSKLADVEIEIEIRIGIGIGIEIEIETKSQLWSDRNRLELCYCCSFPAKQWSKERRTKRASWLEI